MSTEDEDFIGRRVARYRDVAGLSQKQLADRCGVSRPYISQLENGHRPVTTRALLIALADALGVATTDLTGSPRAPRDAEERPIHVAVPAIRAALEGALEPGPIDVRRLTMASASLMSMRMSCEYGRLSHLMAPTLAGIGALAHDSPDDPATQRLLAQVLVTASLVVRPLGYVDLATRLAEHAQRAARRSGEADAIGAATFARAQCSLAGGVQGMRVASLRMAEAGALALEGGNGSSATWYGMLHLHAGLSAASLGRDRDAMGHVAEAKDAARHAPKRDEWMMDFSAANVAVWKVAMVLEGPAPDAAPDVAREVDVRQLHTVQRRAHLLTHTAHGHYARGENDTATALFLAADRIAPSEVRTRSRVREVVGQMLRDARRTAGSDDLRLLAAHVGVEPIVTET